MSSENHVKHLWDCALSLDAETHAKKLLKSYYVNTSRRLAGKKETIPLERFAGSQMCKRCSSHWHENSFKMKLKPQTMDIKTNKARRLIAKLKSQESGEEKGLLTKKQKKRAKWLLKHVESKVEIKCEFCQHKSFVALNKPIKQKSEKTIVQSDIKATTSMELAKSKNKKRKNKDTTAGLKISKVKKEETQEKSLETKVKKKKKTVKEVVNAVSSKSVHLLSTKSTKKSKISNKKEAPKIQSKTQKQNSLLQLAALLKSQDQSKKSVSNSAKSRLESLLE